MMELDPNQQPSNQDKPTGIFIPVKGKTICMEEALIFCQNDQEQADIEHAIREFIKSTVLE